MASHFQQQQINPLQVHIHTDSQHLILEALNGIFVGRCKMGCIVFLLQPLFFPYWAPVILTLSKNSQSTSSRFSTGQPEQC